MAILITSSLIGSIALDISRGRPLWGTLRANENFRDYEQLRKPMVKVAMDKLSKKELPDELRDALMEGATLHDIDHKFQIRQILKEERCISFKKNIPKPRLHEQYGRRSRRKTLIGAPRTGTKSYLRLNLRRAIDFK